MLFNLTLLVLANLVIIRERNKKPSPEITKRISPIIISLILNLTPSSPLPSSRHVYRGRSYENSFKVGEDAVVRCHRKFVICFRDAEKSVHCLSRQGIFAAHFPIGLLLSGSCKFMTTLNARG